MKEKVLSRITNEQLALLLTTFLDVKTVMRAFEVARAGKVAKQSRQFVNEASIETNYSNHKKELQQLEQSVPHLEELIGKLDPESEDREDYAHDLYLKTRRMKKLQKDLENEQPYNFFDDVVNFTSYELEIETFDALADRVGKWFEEGHAGVGTVTYNGKTYISKA